MASHAPASQNVREEGNALYKSGKLIEAYGKYLEASRLAPQDPAPTRNLSATAFELGRYEHSIKFAEEAIELTKASGGHDVDSQVARLQQRLARARTHNFHASEKLQRDRRRDLLTEVRRYRGSMRTNSEYYTVGHDVISSLFEPDLYTERFMMGPCNNSISFLLAGAGDARHFLRTLTVISESEKSGVVPERTYHFTVNDIQKTATSRNLIIWMLLDGMSRLDSGTESALQILNTVFFVFISNLMPPYAFVQLYETIEKAVDLLRSGEQPLAWLYIPPEEFAAYIVVYEHWTGTLKEEFTSRNVMEEVHLHVTTKLSLSSGGPGPDFRGPPGKEKTIHSRFGFLCPSTELLRSQDAQLLDMWTNFDMECEESSRVLRDYMCDHWHFNTTLIDADWYRDKGRKGFYIGFDPFDSEEQFARSGVTIKSKDLETFFDHMAPFFFTSAAQAIRDLNGRFKVEAVIGDYADFAERLAFGLDDNVGATDSGRGFTRPREFSVEYDRIHLSNIPDYMMGNLGTCLFAFSVIRQMPAAYVKSSCLRNSTSWKTFESFLAEYQLITDRKMLRQLTQLQVILEPAASVSWPMFAYFYYGRAQVPPKYSYDSLLPRKEFTKWFYGLFFRLALPFNQDLSDTFHMIYSPLILTVLFRLSPRLITIGYPAHWISELLSYIINDQVRTVARPPRQTPMSVADVERDHPERKLCTRPFSYEMATLAQLFQPTLPFLIISPNLPELKTIRKYTFYLPDYVNHGASENVLVLAFMQSSMMNPILTSIDAKKSNDRANFRPLLDPSWSEVDSYFKGFEFEQLRREGMVIWTAVEWDVKAKKASLWMDEKFVDRCVKEDWHVGLFRTDVWAPVWVWPAHVRESITKGKRFPAK